MIILDTHIWIWWVHGDKRLTDSQTMIIQANETKAIGISAISIWEVAKLVEYIIGWNYHAACMNGLMQL